ncbi:hypothetical protein CEXT_147281 [Caerostris extrusa]|uniref:Uncharacterized protein n=1 Tax=Caerostris extrusa TaxID=172846 RepID=A0AAV4SZN1_CAEEX|nr:hypothetical protein CEXT_147281 [Caerostris extrusa]
MELCIFTKTNGGEGPSIRTLSLARVKSVGQLQGGQEGSLAPTPIHPFARAGGEELPFKSPGKGQFMGLIEEVICLMGEGGGTIPSVPPAPPNDDERQLDGAKLLFLSFCAEEDLFFCWLLRPGYLLPYKSDSAVNVINKLFRQYDG